MSERNRNKKVAAISAVMRYIRREEEALALQPFNASNGVPASATSKALANAWGMSGRQAQMQMRNLMQMKTRYR